MADLNNASLSEQFFIIGRGRSGTTLLSRILNEHPQISVAPEGIFIRNLIAKYGTHKDLTEKEARKLFQEVFQERKMEYWEMDSKKWEEEFVRQAKDKDFTKACRALYWMYGALLQGKDELKWVGDKNPHYSLYVKQLSRLYPNARFLHLIRDPRDNVRSFLQVGFDINDPAGLAYRWKAFERRIRRDVSEMSSDRYQEIRYEDLLRDPESSLKKICAFLGLEFRPEMLEFYKNQEGEDREWHKHLKSPLDSSKIGKWKEAFDPATVQLIENICTPELEMAGYERETHKKAIGIRSRIGRVYGKLVTWMENRIFLIPFSLRMKIINFYRRMAGAK